MSVFRCRSNALKCRLLKRALDLGTVRWNATTPLLVSDFGRQCSRDPSQQSPGLLPLQQQGVFPSPPVAFPSRSPRSSAAPKLTVDLQFVCPQGHCRQHIPPLPVCSLSEGRQHACCRFDSLISKVQH
jgi:hypothetical protein